MMKFIVGVAAGIALMVYLEDQTLASVDKLKGMLLASISQMTPEQSSELPESKPTIPLGSSWSLPKSLPDISPASKYQKLQEEVADALNNGEQPNSSDKKENIEPPASWELPDQIPPSSEPQSGKLNWTELKAQLNDILSIAK